MTATKSPYRIKGDILDLKSKSGSKFRATYAVKLDEKGHKTLQKTGEENIYEQIQEGLEQTLIENILQRAELGDPTALNRAKGSYLDCTDMPKTLAEAQNKIIDIKTEFSSLPVEIRREFDFSPERYVQEYGGNNWLKVMGFTKEEQKPTETKKETKKEEVNNE